MKARCGIITFGVILACMLLAFACCGGAEDDTARTDQETLLSYIPVECGAAITGYEGGQKLLYVPEEIAGLPVVSIESCAFSDADAWMIVLPETVREIADHAFDACSVKVIVLPGALTKIGEAAFARSGVVSMYIPASVQEVGEGAFSDCTELRSVCMDAQIDALPTRTFFECVNLREVILPEHLKSIDAEAFYFCTALETIVFPETLRFVDDHAFAYTQLETSMLPEGAALGTEVFLK